MSLWDRLKGSRIRGHNLTAATLGASVASVLSSPKAGSEAVPKSAADEAKEKQIALWKFNRPLFATQVLGRWEYKPFQVGMLAHKGIMHSQREVSMVLCPRDSGKSEVGTIDDCTHTICHDPNSTNLFCSETATTAQIFLGGVKSHFEDNDGLKYFYGDHVRTSRTWNTQKLVSALRRTKGIKEATLECLGAGNAFVGRHVENMWFDDLISLENANSQIEQRKIVQWFKNVAFPALRPGGKLKIRGTRYSQGDIYGWFLKHFKDKGQGTQTILYRIKSLQENPDGTVYSYFPERYSVETLLELKDLDPVAFAYQYQNDLDAVSNFINVAAIRYISRRDESYPSFEKLIFFIGVDPASGKKQVNDFFATCTVGYDISTGTAYVFRVTKKKLGDPFAMLKHVHDEWDWVRVHGGHTAEIRMEITGHRTVYETYLAYPEKFGLLPLVPVTSSKDKTICLQQQAHWINLGRMVCDTDGFDDLIEQLMGFGGTGHDDEVDALVRALEGISDNVNISVALPIDVIESFSTGMVVFG